MMKKIAINTPADDDAVAIIAIKLSRARPAGKKACMMTMVITNNAKLIMIIILLYQYLFLITAPKKNKICFMSCLPKHELSNTCLAEDRAEFL